MRGQIASLFAALALVAGPAIAQPGPGAPPSGGSGSGTVTSVACPSATITATGSCNPLPAAGTSGHVVTADGANGIADSGTALGALAPLASPTFTGAPAAPTPSTGDSSTKVATTAFVQNSVLQVKPSISSNWYGSPWTSVTTGTSTTANRIVCWLDYEPIARVIKTLATRTTTTLNGSNVSLAKYAADGTGGTPGTLLAHTGSIAMGAAAGNITAATVETTPTIPAGPVWDCSNSDNATVVFQSPNQASNGLGASTQIGDATLANIVNGAALNTKDVFSAQTFGTWNAGGTYTWSPNATTSNAAAQYEQAN